MLLENPEIYAGSSELITSKKFSSNNALVHYGQPDNIYLPMKKQTLVIRHSA